MSDERRTTGRGFGRILVFVYGIFAVAATARAAVQLGLHYGGSADYTATSAYWQSLFSGAVYIVATWALATDRRRIAVATIGVELVGVLVIGTLSQPDDLDRATVWSTYGSGYGYVPLVLPLVGLGWLWRSRSVATRPTG